MPPHLSPTCVGNVPAQPSGRVPGQMLAPHCCHDCLGVGRRQHRPLHNGTHSHGSIRSTQFPQHRKEANYPRTRKGGKGGPPQPTGPERDRSKDPRPHDAPTANQRSGTCCWCKLKRARGRQATNAPAHRWGARCRHPHPAPQLLARCCCTATQGAAAAPGPPYRSCPPRRQLPVPQALAPVDQASRKPGRCTRSDTDVVPRVYKNVHGVLCTEGGAGGEGAVWRLCGCELGVAMQAQCRVCRVCAWRQEPQESAAG